MHFRVPFKVVSQRFAHVIAQEERNFHCPDTVAQCADGVRHEVADVQLALVIHRDDWVPCFDEITHDELNKTRCVQKTG